jgi:hypothetical protein
MERLKGGKMERWCFYTISTFPCFHISMFPHFHVSIFPCLFNVRCSANRAIRISERILLTAFFAVDLELFTTGNTAFIFFRVEGVAIGTGDEIECAGFSPRDKVFLMVNRSDDKVQRQTENRSQKRDQQNAYRLQTRILCPRKDILSYPDDSDDPQKDKDNQDKVHYPTDTIHLKQTVQTPGRFV